MIREIPRKALNGILALLLLTAGSFAAGALVISGARQEDAPLALLGAAGLVVMLVLWCGLLSVQPNQGRVLTLFGDYKGTIKAPGLWWVNPFMGKKAISLRIHNFETAKLKVNDLDSNPIEIGAVVVWQVVDTAEATTDTSRNGRCTTPWSRCR